MHGFFLENYLSKRLTKKIAIRGTIGIAKSSSYPSKFSYKLQTFILPDTMLGFNLDLYNIIKDFSFDDFDHFSLTQATNLYFAINGDLQVMKLKRFSVVASLGTDLISTFASNLYIERLTFRQGRLYSFEPVSYYNKELLIGFNTGLKLQYEMPKKYKLSLNFDKYFGDNSKSGYTKSEWINIGAGISKSLN